MKTLRTFSDKQLLEICAKGEKKCMDVLIERYGDRVMSYIRMNVKRIDEAEDIFQEAFLKVYLSVRSGRYFDNGKFVSWVIRITHNLIVDRYRKRKQSRTMLDAECNSDIISNSENAAVDSSIESDIVYRQTLDDVGTLMRRLPANQRQVIEMRHYSEMSFREIAEETDVSINTALSRMRYGLMNLRRMMTHRDEACV